MRPHLNIGSTESPRPLGEQPTRDTAVDAANPVRHDADFFGGLIQQGTETMRDAHRDAFGNFGIGKRPGGRRQFARGI